MSNILDECEELLMNYDAHLGTLDQQDKGIQSARLRVLEAISRLEFMRPFTPEEDNND